jgi:imidazole glycerol-phosphate synthase subunit HisH
VLTVVDTGLCNVGSCLNMLRTLGAEPVATDDPAIVAAATRVILPGVGSFDAGMHALRSRGLDAALHTAVHERGAPLLGICLGMQLLARRSEEGEAAGLGWIDADVMRFTPQPRLRIPHMGWNSVQPQSPSPLFDAADADPEFYFVHSFHVVPDDPALVTGAATHGGPFAAAVGRGRIHGVQFHPEKSHRHGLQLLRRFLEAA